MSDRNEVSTFLHLVAWLLIMAAAFVVDVFVPWRYELPGKINLIQLAGALAGIIALSEAAILATQLFLRHRRKPAAEAMMVGRLYRLAAVLAIVMAVAYGLGALASVSNFFALFGGMLLGWSLQAPVSGLAAWVLVLLKRPFRPGDRIQFPAWGLVGDVKDIGAMYTVLDQVGGTIGSEEAVGRHILVPNAILFSNVVINYTVRQDAAYMLDEVVVRITYDSKWDQAERILLSAAQDITQEIIAATGVQPYIRSDLYDYGVYMRLRYQTRVKSRAEIAYKLNRRIFENVQRTRAVDMAIPYVYSYRAGMDRKEEGAPRDQDAQNIRQIAIDVISNDQPVTDAQDLEQLAQSIAAQGLLQPIVVTWRPGENRFDILAGHLRFEACKRLGWKSVPAIVRGEGGTAPAEAPPRPRPPAKDTA